MIEEALVRISPLVPPEDIFIVTSEVLQAPIRNALPSLPPENVIAEPLKKNTSGCIALAVATVLERYASRGFSPATLSMAVLTADHAIGDDEAFRSTVATALEHAESTGDIVTIGIKPGRPATEYGYIEAEKSAKGEVHKVLRFREKPNRETAEEFVESGNFLWNSGMFFWRLDTIENGLINHLPDVGKHVSALRTAVRLQCNTPCNGAYEATREIFALFPDISIDFGVMEKAKNVAVVPARFVWDDVGSLDALERLRSADPNGNIVSGGAITLDSRNCIVVNDTNESIAVGVIGLDDVVVVTTPDGVLVCAKDRLQDVKKVVQHLANNGGERFI